MRAAGFLLLSCALYACNPEGPPPVAPVELLVPPLAGSGTTAKGGPPPSGGVDPTRCTASLAPEEIQTASGCELDERLTRGRGQLLFPCKGDGAVEAVFDDHRFAGTVQRGTVVLRLTTELDWQDKCHWETKQELRGSIHVEDGHVRASALVWSYSERPVGPRPGGGSCFTACTATAEVVIE